MERKISALVGLDAHKCSALAFCIKVILQEAHASLRSLLGAMEAREENEEEESGQTLTLRAENEDALGVASGYPNGKPGHVLPGRVESGLTMPSHEG